MEFFGYILIILIFLFLLYMFGKTSDEGKYPPGPQGYPVIGNSLDAVDFYHLHLKFYDWANKYGEIFQVRLFGKTMVVLNSADILREAFLKEPNATILSDRIPAFVGKEFLYNFHDIGFAPYDSEYVKRRKLGFKLIRAYGEGLRKIEGHIHDELNITVGEIENKCDDVALDPEEFIDNFLCSIIQILITGRRFDSDSELIQLARIFDKSKSDLLHPGADYLMSVFPLIKRIPCGLSNIYHRGLAAQSKYFEILTKEKDVTNDNKGIIHGLFEVQSKDIENGVNPPLGMDDIFGIISDINSAGLLTSKGIIWSLLCILLHHREIQKRMQDEVDSAIGSRLPTIDDRVNLPYIEAVIMETMRFTSHIPMSIPHGASSDTDLRGYKIKKGSVIIMNLWTVHHDPNIWEDPFSFCPDRFLDADGGLLPTDNLLRKSLMPFSIGKRSCIGEVFSRLRILLFVAKLMQHFMFIEDETQPVPMLDPRCMQPGLVMMPPRFKCKIIKRHE